MRRRHQRMRCAGCPDRQRAGFQSQRRGTSPLGASAASCRSLHAQAVAAGSPVGFCLIKNQVCPVLSELLFLHHRPEPYRGHREDFSARRTRPEKAHRPLLLAHQGNPADIAVGSPSFSSIRIPLDSCDPCYQASSVVQLLVRDIETRVIAGSRNPQGFAADSSFTP